MKSPEQYVVRDVEAWRWAKAHLRGHLVEWNAGRRGDGFREWDTAECIAENELSGDVERTKIALEDLVAMRVVIDGEDGTYRFWGG